MTNVRSSLMAVNIHITIIELNALHTKRQNLFQELDAVIHLLMEAKLIWLDLVASLPLIKERILVIILLLHFLSLMLGSVLVLMLPLLVWLTPDLRIKKSLLKCNWTIRKRLPRCKMRLKKRLLAFSRRLHARIRKTRYMHKMRC